MTRRLAAAALFLLVVLVIWRETRVWGSFPWTALGRQLGRLNLLLIFAGTALIYLAYLLRSLRWKLLLRPMCRTTVGRVLGPTLIGFTAMALLGRPGEFVRPYLLARRERLTLSSQLGIWTVERLFDVAAFATLFAAAFLLSPDLRRLPHFAEIQRIFLLVIVALALMAGFAAVLYRLRARVAAWVEPALAGVRHRFAGPVGALRSYAGALRAVAGIRALAEIAFLSLFMWGVIACAYWSVIHSMPALRGMTFPGVVLLMAFSMAGSLLQLPGAGGAQLVTIAVLVEVFAVPAALALACGILLWLATYMAAVPAGLVLLHRYGLSLRKLSRDSRKPPEPGAPAELQTCTRSEAAGVAEDGSGF